MDFYTSVPQALQLVLDFDVPDQAVPEAVQSQASLLALLSAEQIGVDTQD
jgi:hypothetical protein